MTGYSLVLNQNLTFHIKFGLSPSPNPSPKGEQGKKRKHFKFRNRPGKIVPQALLVCQDGFQNHTIYKTVLSAICSDYQLLLAKSYLFSKRVKNGEL